VNKIKNVNRSRHLHAGICNRVKGTVGLFAQHNV